MSFHYEPHPRTHQRREQGPPLHEDVHLQVHGLSALGRLNARIGLRVTLVVGTMWCAYAFTLLALVALPGAVGSHNPVVIVAWISQSFVQLVLLPIIMVGQSAQAAAGDARSQATYDDATAILHEVRQIQSHLLELHSDIANLRKTTT